MKSILPICAGLLLAALTANAGVAFRPSGSTPGVHRAQDPGASLDDTYSWDHPQYRAVRAKIEASSGPGTSNCTEHWFTVPIDNFAYVKPAADSVFPATFQIRYYECLTAGWTPGQPILFFTGNEAPIEQFMSWTGIMWENAATLNAKLVWAEHRYFGRSRPWMNESMPAVPKLKYLTPDQALADYSALIAMLRNDTAQDSAIIGVGGSYGGLLTAWMRAKYPWALDGGLASSAPLNLFRQDPNGMARVTTEDATAARGAVAGCDNNIRQAFAAIQAASLSELSSIFNTCAPLSPAAGGSAPVLAWLESALIAMAQSSYPFENNLFLLGAPGIMPPYPLQAACKVVGGTPYSDNTTLLQNVAQAMQIFFNATGTSQCNDVNFGFAKSIPGEVLFYLWRYIACTTVPVESQTNGVSDMFFRSPRWRKATKAAQCKVTYGADLEPNYDWYINQFGGKRLVDTATNVILSNGQYDPVAPGGVLTSTNPAVEAIVFPALGHMGDLAFASVHDSNSTTANRRLEVRLIWSYIQQVQARKK
jgi:lysosomal Pro-X carboxypeptidase